jgi:hypothetical protein
MQDGEDWQNEIEVLDGQRWNPLELPRRLMQRLVEQRRKNLGLAPALETEGDRRHDFFSNETGQKRF